MANYEKVKLWRENTKKRAVEAMGGKCAICHYKNCIASLAFHHLDPKQKDFGIAKAIKSWESIVEELRKCILLCHNCHSEVHAGYCDIPLNYNKFDESFAEYRKPVENEVDNCPVCDKLKPITYKTCSRVCSGKSSSKVNWSLLDLDKELKTKTYRQLGKELGVSDVAVRKQYLKEKS